MSYRDPELSDRWLWEASWKAEHRYWGDARKIILRLVSEVKRLKMENQALKRKLNNS